MLPTEIMTPKIVTSKRTIQFCESKWKIHNFEVWNGELISKVSSLSMDGSLLVWVGGDEPLLSDIALGMPQEQGSLATTLLGDDGYAAGLARRLSSKLHKPVYVCCGKTFDRFTAPLLEKGIALEIKEHPEKFG